MSRQKRTIVILSVFACAAMGCATAGEVARPEFATTHVTLYDCGLAQIERQADVQGASELAIGVEQAHLDDLVASLVLATDGDVKVKGVSFPGVQNLGQAVASSGLGNSMFDGDSGLELPADMLGYARALVGMSVYVEMQNGKKLEGTILDAVLENEPVDVLDPENVAPPPETVVVLVTDVGALRWIPLSEIVQIMPTSQLEAASIQNFASAMGHANGFKETELLLETAEGSSGKLAASYVRQMPIWRIVYKMKVVEGDVILEAWAVVHNDTSEDWKDVSMTLVSGLPTSWVMSLASPRYMHRDTFEAPGSEGELFPQLGAATPDSLMYDWDIYHAEFGLGAFGSSGYGAGGSGYGYGSGYGSLSGSGIGSYYGEGGSSLLKVGESAVEEQMYAEVEDEISTYTAMAPVTLPSGTTSLVPLISRKLPGQAFTLLSAGMQPSTCVVVENGTGLVLQPGMASFYEDGLFRGQEEIDRLEPGDVRVLCYGYDQDIAFSRETKAKNKHEALEYKHETLWVHTLRTTTFTYTIENFAGQPRALAIEVSHIENGRVLSPGELTATESDTRWLAMVGIGERSEMDQIIVIEEGVQTPVSLTVERFEYLMDKPGTLSAEDLAVIEKARKILVKREAIGEKAAAKQAEINKLVDDIAWQTELLAKVPETGGKAGSVDQILSEIMKANKRIAVLEKDLAKLTEDMKEIEDEARIVLEAFATDPDPLESP